ncbi:hypothetical protein BS78_03G155900 [Paspalum vaginatum]|nr:hypothetical protein BS78_03G155900 [Paspalum vaginatum]
MCPLDEHTSCHASAPAPLRRPRRRQHPRPESFAAPASSPLPLPPSTPAHLQPPSPTQNWPQIQTHFQTTEPHRLHTDLAGHRPAAPPGCWRPPNRSCGAPSRRCFGLLQPSSRPRRTSSPSSMSHLGAVTTDMTAFAALLPLRRHAIAHQLGGSLAQSRPVASRPSRSQAGAR